MTIRAQINARCFTEEKLERTLIEKVGHDFGFEYIFGETVDEITLASARHPVHVQVTIPELGYHIKVVQCSSLLLAELSRSFDISIVDPILQTILRKIIQLCSSMIDGVHYKARHLSLCSNNKY